MGAHIHSLDEETINRIAAGEVVERPLNVVKELIENAVDAGASAITVEIRDGGLSYIRVTDNGEGIAREEVRTAFLRHTTSKLKDASELISINSLGFRGEALSSIAAVAMVELLTKTGASLTGVRYCIEGSTEKVFDDVGIPDGTTFIVRNLFYNTPARRKFLKSPAVEAGYISDLMERMMLSHTDISFKLIQGGKIKLQSYGNGKPLDVVYSLYGRDVMESLMPVNASEGSVSVTGYIGRPAIGRGSRSFEIYYVNQRYIRSSLISAALEEAYKPYLMQHRFPFVLLYLDIPPEELDVNVHPSKMEIRFLNEKPLYELLTSEIGRILKNADMIVEIKEAEKAPEIDKPAPEPFEAVRREEEVKALRSVSEGEKPLSMPEPGSYLSESKALSQPEPYTRASMSLMEEAAYGKAEDDKNDPPGAGEAGQLSLFPEVRFLSGEALKRHRIIGQLFKTYWLVEMDDELYMIDQHAAHEKIKYERLIKQLNENRVFSQNISPAQVITLTRREAEVYKGCRAEFERCGFEIGDFGGTDIRISAIPTELYGMTVSEYFHDLLDELMEEKLFEGDSPQNGSSALPGEGFVSDEILHAIATKACKSAVKGNTLLSAEEARALIDELMELEDPYHCPHGRPVIIKLKKSEIEKMFKRIV